jgi:dCMP deaminase
MAVAYLSAQRSKDPAKQVGACIVDSNNIICGIGYNGFPRGCPDDELPWSKLSEVGDPLGTKYPYVCHAEMNAILNKNGASVAGAKLYVTMFPCNECAKLLIQAGIREIVFHEDKAQPKGGTPLPGGGGFKLSQQYAASRRLLKMAGVQVRQHRFQRPFSLTLTNDLNVPSANAVYYNEMVIDEIELNSTGDRNTRMDNQNARFEKKTLKFDDM